MDKSNYLIRIYMRYTQAQGRRRIPLPTAFFVPETALPDGPQSTDKLLNPKRFPTPGGILQGADKCFSLL
jgi:hypothetical protein